MNSGSEMYRRSLADSAKLNYLRNVTSGRVTDREAMQISGVNEHPLDLRKKALEQLNYERYCRDAGIPCSR